MREANEPTSAAVSRTPPDAVTPDRDEPADHHDRQGVQTEQQTPVRRRRPLADRDRTDLSRHTPAHTAAREARTPSL
jgi:hypothetical protein